MTILCTCSWADDSCLTSKPNDSLFSRKKAHEIANQQTKFCTLISLNQHQLSYYGMANQRLYLGLLDVQIQKVSSEGGSGQKA